MPAIDLGVVALDVEAAIQKAAPTAVVDLGTVALTAVAVDTVALPQPGTLAAPLRTTDGAAGNPISFAGAASVSTEPPVIVGAAGAPSVWYVLTAHQAETLTAATAGFTGDTQIEIYGGHPDAQTADDLTLIAFSGSNIQDLGTIPLDATATLMTLLSLVGLPDLGAVALDATATLAVTLS